MTTTLATTDAATPVPAAPAHHVETNTGISHTKLAFWAFLGSECLFFGAFITTYLLYRGRDQMLDQPPYPRELFDIPFTSVTSFILLMSSLTMVLALSAIQRNDNHQFRIWLASTALFGMLFIGGQVYEFAHMVHEIQLINPDGPILGTNMFTSTFFILTGLHGAHVTVGIFWLLSLYARSLQGRLGPQQSEAVEIAGLYWHFVDIVWIVIFTAIYLVPQS